MESITSQKYCNSAVENILNVLFYFLNQIAVLELRSSNPKFCFRCEAVCRECGVQYRCIGGVDSTLQEEMLAQLRGTLHSQMPPTAPSTVNAIYAVAFRIYVKAQLIEYRKFWIDCDFVSCWKILVFLSSISSSHISQWFRWHQYSSFIIGS